MTVLFSISAEASAQFVCDRSKVLQGIELARTSPEFIQYTKTVKKPLRPTAPHLQKILTTIEQKVFGAHFVQMDDVSYWPGATMSGNLLGFSSITDKDMREGLKNPVVGEAFTIAHEIGHFVQAVSFAHNNGLSPNGLPNATPRGDTRAFNTMHSETDCIAIELMHQAGYPLTEDISETLSQIRKECNQESGEAFCTEADQIRQSTVAAYIQSILESGK